MNYVCIPSTLMNKVVQRGCHLWNAKIPGKAEEKIAATAADGSVHAKQLRSQPVKSIVKAVKLNGNLPEGNPIHNRPGKYLHTNFIEEIEIENEVLIFYRLEQEVLCAYRGRICLWHTT